MKKIISIFIFIVLAINILAQNINSLIGDYSVTNIWSEVSGYSILRTDTSYFNIKIMKYTDNQILIVNYPPLDTIKATVISDSIYIYLQTIYYDESFSYMIHGSGRIFSDTIKYQCYTGSSYGSFDNNCVAVKIKGNSTNNLSEKKKKIIIIYSIANKILNLKLTNGIHGEIILYTTDGKQVLKRPLTEKESIFYVPVSGLLLYSFENENGEVQIGKVMVR